MLLLFDQDLNDRTFKLRSKVEGEWCIGYDDMHSERMWLNLQSCNSPLAGLWNMNEYGTIHAAGNSSLCVFSETNTCVSGDTGLFVTSCDEQDEASRSRWRVDSTGSIYCGGSHCAIDILEVEVGGSIVMRPKTDSSTRQQWYLN